MTHGDGQTLRELRPGTLAEGVLAGDLRSLSRAISLVEDRADSAADIAEAVFPATGVAHVVGVTGPPGVGKSTLVDRLITHVRATGRRVAVVAVDPSSTGSGGALLGDRVRMTRHALDQGVFVRSLATRGRLGGLAEAAIPTVRLLDAAGFEMILIETVGVGQAEIEVAETADCVVVVVAPGAGDVMQAAKSGVLEIGDAYVVNRADDPTSRGLRRDLESIFAIRGREPMPPIVETVATLDTGVITLMETVDVLIGAAASSGALHERRVRHLAAEVLRTVGRRAADDAVHRLGRAVPAHLEEGLRSRSTSPDAAVAALLDTLDIPLTNGGNRVHEI